MTITLSGPIPERTLVQIARELQDRIEILPGVLEVDIGGDREEVVEILIDPLLLETYNLSLAEVYADQAAISIDKLCRGEDVSERPAPGVNLFSTKMGVHEWSYDNAIESDLRYVVPQADKKKTLSDRKMEVELGFDRATGFKEAQRCLNCDVQTVFEEARCIECDACVDICPTDCITFTLPSEEPELRTQLSAPSGNLAQDLYVSEILPTKRVMVKDEDVCLHCGLCAERCPTTAWDMQQFLYNVTKAGQ